MADEVKDKQVVKENQLSFGDFLDTKSLTAVEKRFYLKKLKTTEMKTQKYWETKFTELEQAEQNQK